MLKKHRHAHKFGFKSTTYLHFFCAWFAKFKSLFFFSDVRCLPSHMLNASKQEPLELFCFILAVVCVSFVFLFLYHIVFSPPHPPLPTSERVCVCASVYHCGTLTVTAGRRNSGVLAADGSTHFFIP